MALRSLRFGGKLDTYRRLKGLTIAELSERVGIPGATMERLLTGRNAPCAATLLRIMRTLEIHFEPEDFEQEGMP